jgi:dsDNA-specific endonuclease/ATPase MutS2
MMEYDPSKMDVVRITIGDVLDLHSVSPRDIIHGRGIGVQREAVRKILERTSFVEYFHDAPAEAGGWGATVVTLR